MQTAPVTITLSTFVGDDDPSQLAAVIELRSAVFIVEQFVPLHEEVFQTCGGAADAGVPHPCAFCAGVGFAAESALRLHTGERHGGIDRYRRRFIHEIRMRRPVGVHSGKLTFMASVNRSIEVTRSKLSV